MADTQPIRTPSAPSSPAADVSRMFPTLRGLSFEAAVRYAGEHTEKPLTVDLVRELVGVGVTAARTILRRFVEAGITVLRWLRDEATGRMTGRCYYWIGPRAEAPGDASVAGSDEASANGSLTPDSQPLAERAMRVLTSLAIVDQRLAFREHDLRGLVPLAMTHLEAGMSETDLVRLLADDLPGRGKRIKTGLLHHRLSRALPSQNTQDTQRAQGGPGSPAAGKGVPTPRTGAEPATSLTECAECGRPARDLPPGGLCRPCRGEADEISAARLRELRRARMLGQPAPPERPEGWAPAPRPAGLIVPPAPEPRPDGISSLPAPACPPTPSCPPPGA